MIEDYLKGALLLSDDKIRQQHEEVKQLIKNARRLIFIGNGGSMSSCSHMAHDFLKVGKIKTLCPESPNLITCLANDYGVEQMWEEWLEIQREPGDLLIVISSSGNSQNLINAVKYFKRWDDHVVTITGFSPDNKLAMLGEVNVYLATDNFGVHEQYAGIFLHSILDDLVKESEEKAKNSYFNNVKYRMEKK